MQRIAGAETYNDDLRFTGRSLVRIVVRDSFTLRFASSFHGCQFFKMIGVLSTMSGAVPHPKTHLFATLFWKQEKR